MSEENQQIAESIRSGRYFNDAKGWYEAVCIGPISERTYFLVIAILAIFVGITGFISLMRLLPVTTQPAIILGVKEKFDERMPWLVNLRQQGNRPAEAVENFFVAQYVVSRESYSAAQFQTNARFVLGQSEPTLYNAYVEQQKSMNLPATLGNGKIAIQVDALSIRPEKAEDGTPTGIKAAEVDFTATTTDVPTPTKSRWTAKMKYHYTSLNVSEQKNAETGELEMLVTDPQFQVISYAVEQKK